MVAESILKDTWTPRAREWLTTADAEDLARAVHYATRLVWPVFPHPPELQAEGAYPRAP